MIWDLPGMVGKQVGDELQPRRFFQRNASIYVYCVCIISYYLKTRIHRLRYVRREVRCHGFYLYTSYTLSPYMNELVFPLKNNSTPSNKKLVVCHPTASSSRCFVKKRFSNSFCKCNGKFCARLDFSSTKVADSSEDIVR